MGNLAFSFSINSDEWHMVWYIHNPHFNSLNLNICSNYLYIHIKLKFHSMIVFSSELYMPTYSESFWIFKRCKKPKEVEFISSKVKMLIFTDIFSKPNDCCKNYNSEQDWFIMHTVAAYLAFTKGENIVTKKNTTVTPKLPI